MPVFVRRRTVRRPKAPARTNSNAPTARTLSAGAGTFAVSGTAVALRNARRIAASSGSYADTGTAATLRHGYVLTPTAPFIAQDIGTPSPVGHDTYASGTYTLISAGADILGTADECRFVFEPLEGDGEIIARVATVQHINDLTKAGVMIRGDLSAGAANVSVLVTAARGTVLQSRLTAGGDTTSTATSSGGGTSVLQPSDLTYLGSATMPFDVEGVTRWGFSTGAMTGRVIGGNIHIYMSGANWDVGWNDQIYECVYNGVGNRMSFVQNWGDLCQGDRPTLNMGYGRDLRSILWDDVSGQMIWSYMDGYSDSWDPSIGSSIFNSDGSTTKYGPWTPGTKSQYCAGYTYKLPPRAQAALGGKYIASGAPYTSRDSGSTFGTFMTAWAIPSNSTPADTPGTGHSSIPTTDLLFTNISNKQARINDVDYCGWLHYGEGGDEAHQPQLNPTQNGSGCNIDGAFCGAPFGSPFFGSADTWQPGDQVGSAVWIEGTNKQGLIYFGQIGRTLSAHVAEYGIYSKAHVWYGPGNQAGTGFHQCAHGQVDSRYGVGTGNSFTTQANTLWIYDPADILAVAAGTKSNIGVVPATDGLDMSLLPNSGTPFPQLATTWNAPWGAQLAAAWFEPASKLLFVSSVHTEFVGEFRPIVHVFAVNC